MNDITRKEFLRLLGASGVALTIVPAMGENAVYASASMPLFTPVRVPHPLPIFRARPSFLPTGLKGQGEILEPGSLELSSYTVIDDLIVPPECESYIILKWGDRVFIDDAGNLTDEYFGYNNDFTAFVPTGKHAGWLVVNHEYISYPFHQLSPGTPTAPSGYPAGPRGRSFEEVIGDKIGLTLPNAIASTADKVLLYGEFLYNVGLSVVRIRLNDTNNYVPVKVRGNRRVTGLSGLALNAGRRYPTSWGSLPHQQGDDHWLLGTGPAAETVFARSSDGLGRKIIGTIANCSGAVTQWGTALCCEENFQGDSRLFVGVTEAVKSDGTQTGYTADTVGEVFGLVGEKYGWVVEVDALRRKEPAKKHTALGRFRHENLALRVQIGNPLVCYLGDDRRGGHWWKFVSSGTVGDPKDPHNSALFEDGTLYVAQFHQNGTGRWVPLKMDTRTNPNDPSLISSVQLAQQGSVDANGLVRLPLRLDTPAVSGSGSTPVVPADGGFANVDITNQAVNGLLDYYRNKTVGDFYASLGAALCDAFLAGNLIGGTPSARPEDCEVDPVTHIVYLSNTDGRPSSSEGYPDSRIFVVGKYESAANSPQQFGDLLKLTENSPDGAGTTFTWSRLAQGSEVGTNTDANADPEPGDGFGNADNLAFGPRQTLWVCIDQSTNLHNGFSTGLVNPGGALAPTSIDHAAVGSSAAEGLIGVFGNNWLFFVPTDGPNEGEVIPFAIGPTRCEMTGPTFIGSQTLILSIQHPGEDCAIRETAAETQTRNIPILKADGSGVFDQSRTITKGSQWPSNVLGVPAAEPVPIPCVVGIRRKTFTSLM